MDHDEQQKAGCFGPLTSLFNKVVPSLNGGSKFPSVAARSGVANEKCVTERYNFDVKYTETPPPYASDMMEEPIFRPDVLKTMEAKVDELDSELRKLSLQIHDHPELMFKEKFAHDALTKFMSSHGFTITPHYLGLSTAWRASFKHGKSGPVLGVNSEMDALPGIGHACGHNLIAIAGIGVALGVKAALEAHDIPGEVVLLGTPAEEGGGGKITLLERGGYDNMDACIMCHPGPGPDFHFDVPDSLAIQIIDVEFFGHTAHASAAPWEGINALDAAVLSYTNISALRQQIKPTHRVHGIIEGRDWAPNVIPDYAKMSYIVRAPTADEVIELAKRVTACFKAAAQATGCTHKLTQGTPYSELIHNSALRRSYTNVAMKRYKLTASEPTPARASTDFGNISHALPGLHPGYTIPATSSNHTPEFTKATRTTEAHTATLWTTKALAATGIRLLADDKFLKEVKDTFEASKKFSRTEEQAKPSRLIYKP